MRRRRLLVGLGVAGLVVLLLGSSAAVLLLERDPNDGNEESGGSGVASYPAIVVQRVGPPAIFGFDRDPTGQLPEGFVSARTGPGSDGQWVVRRDNQAPSPPNVLTQASTDDTGGRFPMAVATAGSDGDLDMSVQFKPISGRVDQAGGVVFRYRDVDNYYLVRANALEDNVRFYHVVDGRRTQVAGAAVDVSSGAWHELRVVNVGDGVDAYFDGARVVAVRDRTFQQPGLVGVWTKADSVTAFDDLVVWEVRAGP